MLAREFGVSEMTVRRDLRLLEQAGHARVVRGGVSLPSGTSRSVSFLTRARKCTDAKARIAACAAELVGATDSIAIDSGTTAYALAGALPDTFGGSVVTNSMPVIQLLMDRPEIAVLCLGGNLVHPREAFAGSITADAAARVRVRTFFLAAPAIDAKGVYIVGDGDRASRLALMDAADSVVLLVDHEKFLESRPLVLATLDRLATVVTDRAPPAALHRALDDAGVEVLIADKAAATRVNMDGPLRAITG
jgi:DeoR/GlpR family transcriptional regulator of sugar metabolism